MRYADGKQSTWKKKGKKLPSLTEAAKSRLRLDQENLKDRRITMAPIFFFKAEFLRAGKRS